jgi:2-haloacid dehalogenase
LVGIDCDLRPLTCGVVTEASQRIDAVVFDVGGVLLDWNPEYLYRRLIADEGERRWFLTEVCSPEWNSAQDAGRSWADAISELSARFPEHRALIKAYDERWEEMVAGPIEDSVVVLEDLRSSGVPTYALTNFSAEKWALAKNRWDFLDGFDGEVVSGVVGVTKPHPEIYQILLDRYRLEPPLTLYTDDLAKNVEAARYLGIAAELFVDASTLRRQLIDRGVLDS